MLQSDREGCYKLSNMTGSLRYMAPGERMREIVHVLIGVQLLVEKLFVFCSQSPAMLHVFVSRSSRSYCGG